MKINGVDVSGFAIDSRKATKGSCFVAIKTERDDGHAYLQQAKANGAAMALVEKRQDDVDLNQCVVDDSIKAMGELARAHRLSFLDLQLVALTGSCGKTTTRQFLETILSLKGATNASIKSFNNHLGVPMSLATINATHEYMVQEMGANHPGEIAYLTDIARPNVALITNAGPVHLEGFKSVEGVSRAKGEIYQGLMPGGVAVVNADDVYADYWRDLNKERRVISFALDHDADVMAKQINVNDEGFAHFDLQIAGQTQPVQLAMLGLHNVQNALGASACAYALGLDISVIAKGLEASVPVERRMQVYQFDDGVKLLDDSYNANPKALKAAIDVLVSLSGQSILVLGDMGELGDDAKKWHADIGAYAKHSGVNTLYTVGDLTSQTAKAFGDGAQHFADKPHLIEVLMSHLQKEQVVLVKGSLSMAMDEITIALKNKGAYRLC